MDFTPTFLILGLAIPALIGALTGFACALLKRRAPPSAPASASIPARILAVIGLTVGLFIAFFGISDLPRLSLLAMEDRLGFVPLLVGVVGLAGVLYTAFRSRGATGDNNAGWRIAWKSALLGAAGGSILALGKSLWSGALGSSAWLILFISFAALAAGCVGGIVRAGARIVGSIVLVGICLATGGLLLVTAGQELGEYGFGIAAVAVGLAIGVLAARGSPGPGTIAFIAASLGSLLAAAVMLSNTLWWQVSILAVAAPAAWLVHRTLAPRTKPLTAAIAAILAAAAIAAIPVALGAAQAYRESQTNGPSSS